MRHRISLDTEGLARPPGAQEFQDLLPFLSKVLPDLLYLQAGMESGQCPGRSEAGQRPGKASILMSLTKDLISYFSHL